MTIDEVMFYALDDGNLEVEIYDVFNEETICFDCWDNIKNEYGDKEICSWNTRMDGAICFNIDSSFEE